MGVYNFRKDLKTAGVTEKQIGKLIEVVIPCKVLKFNNNSDYDILIEEDGEQRTIEVKEDMFSRKSGNIAVEFFSRNKPSGISVSKSDYYIYKIHFSSGLAEYRIIDTKKLKSLIKFKMYFKEVSGGDTGSDTRMYLFKLSEFRKFSKIIEIPICSDYKTNGSKACVWYSAIKGKEGVCIKPNVSHFLCEYTLRYLIEVDK